MKQETKKCNVNRLIYLILSLAILLSMFLPAVSVVIPGVDGNADVKELYNGFNIVFGKRLESLSGYTTVNGYFDAKIRFGILPFISYFLPIISYLIVKLLKKDDNVMCFAMVFSFLISAVLMFLILNVTNITLEEYQGNLLYNTHVINLKTTGFKMTFWSFLTGFIGCVGTIFSFMTRPVDKTKQRG